MKIMLDVNVVLDVIQKREPHYRYSAIVLSEVLYKHVEGILAGHELTTVYYLIAKYFDRQVANEKTDWLLENFDIVSADKSLFIKARKLSFEDFEDAVVAVIAEVSGCDYIVTRNVSDFEDSTIPTIAPEDFVRQHVFNRTNSDLQDFNYSTEI